MLLCATIHVQTWPRGLNKLDRADLESSLNVALPQRTFITMENMHGTWQPPSHLQLQMSNPYVKAS